ncbi:ATPase family associated with various cellular activities (AAA) subfamily protein, partial [Cardiosporidium cionae]
MGASPLDSAASHAQFVVTPSVRTHLRNLARILSGGRFPVLLEGPTSSGKTALVAFLCQLTGHKFVRINNHEHTDLQEYLGQHTTDETTGQLIFQEGILVQAARQGDWVVLDELNLAPSDVLEALNRLLDDNRELYIPETNTVIHAHEDFMIFATQNPAGGAYGGRKALSKAFRNRFIELFVDELPSNELEVILTQRCVVAPSRCASMLKVYEVLKERRMHS